LDLYVVLCGNNNCYSVEYFLLNEVSDIVYAYGHTFEIQELQHVCQFAGYHLLVVKSTLDVDIFEVDKIKGKQRTFLRLIITTLTQVWDDSKRLFSGKWPSLTLFQRNARTFCNLIMHQLPRKINNKILNITFIMT